MAERSKQRKVDAENRQFNKEWTDKWLFVLPVGGMKPMCLICNATVAVVKSSSGRENGLVAKVKNINPNVIAFHCIIHQSVLCKA